MHTPIVGILRQKISGMSANDYASILRNKHGITNIKIAETPDERGELLTSASIITGDLIQEKDIDKAENLDLFACVNAGTGHLPLEMLSEHDIAVTNASGVHAPNIAEHVLGAILIHVHDFKQAWQQQQSGLWASYPVSKLQESTVTVVGLGAIGNAVINRLDPFDVDTIGIRYSPKKGGLTDEILGFEDIDDALARTDYLILASPLTETTRGIIYSDALLTLPSDAFIVNISRGSVI
jgi:phosphoglycerate dehydrogenase-like enzyme